MPRDLLDRHPVLWRLPPTFGLWVARNAKPGDVDLLVAMGARVVEVSQMQTAQRLPERVAESAIRRLSSNLTGIRLALHPQELRGLTPYRTVLETVHSPEDAALLLARIIAAAHRRVSQPRSRVAWNDSQRRADRIRIDFHLLLQCGIFEGQGVRCDTKVHGGSTQLPSRWAPHVQLQ